MSAEQIIQNWKKGSFSPVYLLDGDEDYYIDQVVHYAEHELLKPEESAFNLTVFYGKDSDWANVVNACRRYPMQSDRQVVLIKEAQHFGDLDKMSAYFESPMPSTVLVIAHKGKKLDQRLKVTKVISQKGEVFHSMKMRDDQVPSWIRELARFKGLNISAGAVTLLHDHIGNDLSRIAGEIDKLTINMEGKADIDENAIEKYVGISKEYNVFELQAAIASLDLAKAITILNYFESNPKSVSIHAALPALYSLVGKVYGVYGLANTSDSALRPVFYNNPVAVAQARLMMKNYGFEGMEKMILLMNEYNLRSLGVGDTGTSGASLMKEMVVKMMMKEN